VPEFTDNITSSICDWFLTAPKSEPTASVADLLPHPNTFPEAQFTTVLRQTDSYLAIMPKLCSTYYEWGPSSIRVQAS